MPERMADYARLAAEAFLAASREPDLPKAALLRQKGYDFVNLIQQSEAKLEQRLSSSHKLGGERSDIRKERKERS